MGIVEKDEDSHKYSKEAEELAYAWFRTGYPLEHIAEQYIAMSEALKKMKENIDIDIAQTV